MFLLCRQALTISALVCGLALALPSLAAPSASESDPVAQLLADRELAVAAAARTAQTAHTDGGGNMRQSASHMIDSAMNFLGVRYIRGGNSAESGFDCSGFTRFVFENSVGLVLPRRADEQAHAPGLQKVSRDSLAPGDLVFFNTLRRTFSHVGIYVGNGKFIHSPRRGGHVRVEDMSISYWAKRFTGARRADLPGGGIAPVPASTTPQSAEMRFDGTTDFTLSPVVPLR